MALIDALQSKDALAPLLAALHLETSDSGFFFAFGSNEDYAHSNQLQVPLIVKKDRGS
jgi:hypothetical protein